MKHLFTVTIFAIAVCIVIAGCGGGGGGSTTVVVRTVKIAPTSASVFADDTITFNASGGDAPYAWTSGDTSLLVFMAAESAADGTVAVFRASGSGSTQVFVIDAAGRRTEADVTVRRRAPRVVPFEAAVQATGSTNPATVTFRVSGGFPPYTWAVSNPTIAEITGDSTGVEEVTVTAKTIGSTQVIVYDDSNSMASAVLNVTALYPRISPSKALIGLSTTLDLIAFRGAAPYIWEVSDPTLGTLSANLTNEGESVTLTASPTREGTLYVKVTDSVGLVEQAVIEISRIIPTIIPGEASLLGGESIVLNILGGTTPFIWTTDAPAAGVLTFLDAPDNTMAQFTASEILESGVANLVVTDGTGQVSGGAVISVASFFELLPTSVTISQGDSVTFTISGGKAPYQAVLSNLDAGSASVTDNKITVNIRSDAVPGDYVLQVTDDNGVLDTANLTVEETTL